MRDQVFKLKKLVYEMESYIYNNNKDKIFDLAKEISEVSSVIMSGISSNKSKSNTEIEEQVNNDLAEDIKVLDGLEYLNTIEFLYKPVTKKNYYDGDYLEKFSTQRTDELQRANVIEIHNRFWAINEIEKGNIFGSIPKELINDDSKRLLLRYGWEEAKVNIYKFSVKSRFEATKLCGKNFEKYLIIKEKKNGEYFALEYKEGNS